MAHRLGSSGNGLLMDSKRGTLTIKPTKPKPNPSRQSAPAQTGGCRQAKEAKKTLKISV